MKLALGLLVLALGLGLGFSGAALVALGFPAGGFGLALFALKGLELGLVGLGLAGLARLALAGVVSPGIGASRSPGLQCMTSASAMICPALGWRRPPSQLEMSFWLWSMRAASSPWVIPSRARYRRQLAANGVVFNRGSPDRCVFWSIATPHSARQVRNDDSSIFAMLC